MHHAAWCCRSPVLGGLSKQAQPVSPSVRPAPAAGDHESAKATFPLVPTHYEKAGKWHPKTEGEVRVPALKCRALQLKLQEEVHAAASG